MVGASIHISQHREKNCAEDEDKTTHAERPYEPSTDEFDRPPPSATEFRQIRDAKSRNLKSAPTWNRDPRVGFAQERVNREAAREAREHDELSTRDQSKQRQIAEKMEDYFLELEPMHQNVKRFCRVSVPNVWKRVVQHCDLCSAGKRCEFAFKQKGAPLIAESILSVTLHNLSTGFVDLQHLQDVEHPHIWRSTIASAPQRMRPTPPPRSGPSALRLRASLATVAPIPSPAARPTRRCGPRRAPRCPIRPWRRCASSPRRRPKTPSTRNHPDARLGRQACTGHRPPRPRRSTAWRSTPWPTPSLGPTSTPRAARRATSFACPCPRSRCSPWQP